MANEQPAACPVAHDHVDRRKAAPLAAQNTVAKPGAHRVRKAEMARAVLRNPHALQAGVDAEELHIDNPEHFSVFFLDGMLHHKKRLAIAKFFSQKTVTTQHRPIMEKTTERLLNEFRRKGEARIDDMSFDLAASVVSEILGLTNSNHKDRVKRVARVLETSLKPKAPGLLGAFQNAYMMGAMMLFMYLDLMPAKRARMKQRKNDVISLMLDADYPDKALMIEALTYGSAGMTTTREFIVMASWYLFERPELRELYLNSDEQGQLNILLEILRLEPIASMLHRRVNEDMVSDGETLPSGELYAIDIRAANVDEEMVGACPFALDPERATRQRENGRYMSFGDGPHNCPGWQVAMHESRIFIDRMFRVPGIKLARAPDISWHPGVQGYELRNAIVTCDRIES